MFHRGAVLSILVRMTAQCSVCAGQTLKTDDIFLHPSHALCPPQPRPLRGHRGEAQHAQQADQDCEAVTEVRIPASQPANQLSTF